MVRIRVNHQIHFILNKRNNNNIMYNTQSISKKPCAENNMFNLNRKYEHFSTLPLH